MLTALTRLEDTVFHWLLKVLAYHKGTQKHRFDLKINPGAIWTFYTETFEDSLVP
jgi:hypothetical protein